MKVKILTLVVVCALVSVLSYATKNRTTPEGNIVWEKEYLAPPIADAGWDIITYVGVATQFEGGVTPGHGQISKYEWDFDGDGVYEWSSPVPMPVSHIYRFEGTYQVAFRVTDEYDLSWTDVVEVRVKPGKGRQRFVKPPVERPTLFGKSLKSKDGVSNKYAILINGSGESRFWVDIDTFYTAFHENLEIDSSDIYVLNYNGTAPNGENPDNMIDYRAKLACLDTVFYRLANEDSIDADDHLYIMITDHGASGDDYSVQEGDEPDVVENLFVYRHGIKLDKWGVIWGIKIQDYPRYYRYKRVSQFDSLYVVFGDSTAYDDDIWLEFFKDYLAGDSVVTDGYIDTTIGEVFDFDGDSIPPYNPEDSTFDEDDWGDIDSLRDDECRTPSNRIPKHQCCYFDSTLDNTVDVDVDCDSFPVSPAVDGTDIDNDGDFDGVDMNSDGDMEDWVSIDEYACLYNGRLTDDYLAAHLDSLGEVTAVVMMMSCYSGGFVWDLSGPKRVTMTPCGDEYSYGNLFVRCIAEAIIDPGVADDLDTDGCASMTEIFNYTAERYGEGSTPHYDDNGDHMGHTDPLPNGGDGIWGRVLFFEECPTWGYLLYYSHAIDDSLFNDNDVVNPGDTIHMSLTIEHTGLIGATAEDVVCTLSTDNPYITLIDSVKSFGDIDSAETATSIGNFVFAISDSFPDSSSAKFTLHAYAGDSLAGVSSFYQLVVKPDFILTVVPGTLIVYHSGLKGKSDRPYKKVLGYDIIVEPVGGFKWPVNLSSSGFCSGIKTTVIMPNPVTPPDTAHQGIALSLFCEPQICSTITYAGRGAIPGADSAIHEVGAILVVRQAPPNTGPVWHVSTQGDDLLGDGKEDWPLRTIQKGIEYASPGDTVLVEKGIYEENILIEKDSIVVASHYARDPQESYIESTIIDGQDSGRVVTFNSSNEATLYGFTIQNGDGAGVYCSGSTPKIHHNVITGNDISEAGIYCTSSDPDIKHNTITANYNGISISTVFSACIFRNLIYANNSTGIFMFGVINTQLVNNSISDNQGDGVAFYNASLLVKNNIISHNGSYGLRQIFGGDAWMKFNDVWGNEAGNYGFMGDSTGYNGNISYDPLYGYLEGGNLHLAINSPCIDSGDPADSVPPGGGDRIDIGAIEYTCTDTTCGDANRDCFIDQGDPDYLSAYLFQGGPPPDPFWIGDVNCDDEINLEDVLYLINYLYHNGPAPCTDENCD